MLNFLSMCATYKIFVYLSLPLSIWMTYLWDPYRGVLDFLAVHNFSSFLIPYLLDLFGIFVDILCSCHGIH